MPLAGADGVEHLSSNNVCRKGGSCIQTGSQAPAAEQSGGQRVPVGSRNTVSDGVLKIVPNVEIGTRAHHVKHIKVRRCVVDSVRPNVRRQNLETVCKMPLE